MIDSITLRGPIVCTITTLAQESRNDNIVVVDHLFVYKHPDHIAIYMVTDDILTVWQFNKFYLIRYGPRSLQPGDMEKLAKGVEI